MSSSQPTQNAHNSNIKQNITQAQMSANQKKIKMQKPTINLSINNNVQNVIVTPIGG